MENQKTKSSRVYLPMIALIIMASILLLFAGCSTTATMTRVANNFYSNNYTIDIYNSTLEDWQNNIPQAEFSVDSLGTYTWSAGEYDVNCKGFTATNPDNGITLYVLDCGADEINAVMTALENTATNSNGPEFAYARNGNIVAFLYNDTESTTYTQAEIDAMVNIINQ